MNLEKRLAEIFARKVEIRGLLDTDGEVNLEEITTELKGLESEEAEIRSKLEVLESLKNVEEKKFETKVVETRDFKTSKEEKEEKSKKEEIEERGRALKENRAVTVGSSNIVVPKHQSSNINPTFGEVSSLIDRVNTIMLPGGESFTQPYSAGYGTGDYKEEAADYATAEATFNYAEINKAKITAYSEVTEEVQKLPAADYEGLVIGGIRVALRKVATRDILIGAGTTNKLVGIFSDKATAIDAATDLPIATIDGDTLTNIIYSYGGDEEVEDAAVLILNKLDLKAFAQLKTTSGERIHTIVTNGNTGTIDGIPFIINSACKAISHTDTAENDYSMAYGSLSNYMLAVFSDVDVQRSNDYKFKQGMVAHKGSVFLGGNVTSKNGFLRVKKAVDA